MKPLTWILMSATKLTLINRSPLTVTGPPVSGCFSCSGFPPRSDVFEHFGAQQSSDIPPGGFQTDVPGPYDFFRAKPVACVYSLQKPLLSLIECQRFRVIFRVTYRDTFGVIPMGLSCFRDDRRLAGRIGFSGKYADEPVVCNGNLLGCRPFDNAQYESSKDWRGHDEPKEKHSVWGMLT